MSIVLAPEKTYSLRAPRDFRSLRTTDFVAAMLCLHISVFTESGRDIYLSYLLYFLKPIYQKICRSTEVFSVLFFTCNFPGNTSTLMTFP